jgi:hypothetical protein
MQEADVCVLQIEKGYTQKEAHAARDCQHWSPGLHQEVADLMIQQYKEIVNNAG